MRVAGAVVAPIRSTGRVSGSIRSTSSHRILAVAGTSEPCCCVSSTFGHDNDKRTTRTHELKERNRRSGRTNVPWVVDRVTELQQPVSKSATRPFLSQAKVATIHCRKATIILRRAQHPWFNFPGWKVGCEQRTCANRQVQGIARRPSLRGNWNSCGRSGPTASPSKPGQCQPKRASVTALVQPSLPP